MNIYDFITSKATLSIPHQIELKEKRGFSDETIAKCRFFSGGEHLSSLIPEIIATFTEGDILASKILTQTKGSWCLSDQLKNERIVIPYIGKESGVYSIRPHKFGLPGIANKVYQDSNIAGRSLVITEGEFKASALIQSNVPAISLPGIGSFSDRSFPDLVKLLKDNSVEEICIIFDNEVKDDPQFKERYKEEAYKRYDTQFYAWLMCKMLCKEGFDCRIGWLPDEWRVNGKADLDGALAQGKTSEDFRRVISLSKDFKQFFYDQTPIIQKIIKRKEKKRYFRTCIKQDFGCYVATRYEDGAPSGEERISNFLIKVVSTHETPDGIMRSVRFTNEFGESSPTISMSPEHMSSADSFSTFCFAQGNFVWRGRKTDLQNIWEEEFLDDDGRHIIEPDHIGYIKRENIWVFGNVAFKDGQEIDPDAQHVFWSESKGIKPLALGISQGRTEISEGIPVLKKTPFDIQELRSKLSGAIGDDQAKMALGWCTSVLFMEEVFEVFNCFPFLFMTGKRRSGKSTISEWLMNMFGLEGSGKGASDTTQVGLQRYLAYYSSLPLFVDEYRNSKQVATKNGFLRNAYNRQSAGKGIKSDFGVREARIRGTLLLAGEETPEDNALLTRCIVINVSERQRVENHYNWFMANRGKFSYHTYNILRRKKELLPTFLKVLQEAKNAFVAGGSDDRTAINYAICCAGYAVAFGEQDINFANWVVKETVRVREEYDSEQATTVFLEDILALRTNGAFHTNLWHSDHDKIYLYFKGMYNIWSEDFRRRRGIEPFKDSAIRDYLKEEDGFIELNKAVRIGGQLRKCMVFDRAKSNELLRYLVDNA